MESRPTSVMMVSFEIRELRSGDRPRANRLIQEQWGSTRIVTRGRIHETDTLPGFVALRDDQPIGLVTYRIEGSQCEIVTLNSLVEGVGVGSALIAAVKSAALRAGCTRLWLITTNDNVEALHFYQKRRFRLVAVYPNALDA